MVACTQRARIRPRRVPTTKYLFLLCIISLFGERPPSSHAFYLETSTNVVWGHRPSSIPRALAGQSEPSSESSNNDSNSSKKHVQRRRRRKQHQQLPVVNVTTAAAQQQHQSQLLLQQRVTQLEQLVAKQSVEIKRLKNEVHDLTNAAAAFARVIELLREAGLQTDQGSAKDLSSSSKQRQDDTTSESSHYALNETATVVESFDDDEIFGTAPASVIEAADAAGASILAALLAGKQRMLVDVRDAELSTDFATLVQFIELAILPVAAGLEGLRSQRNRLKIVFPAVSQLLDYRKTMALAAPEVVALSTLGFDPAEEQDNLVVIVAPSPDDEEGCQAMNELFEPSSSDDPSRRKPIQQPVVVLNHHMIPLSGPAADFEVAYHLRLLSVQYMTGTGDMMSEKFLQFEEAIDADAVDDSLDAVSASSTNTSSSTAANVDDTDETTPEDAALEAAMKRAHQVGTNHGMTRAMVIRAYPKPWHVFVDTSPDTDADFEVAATFDEEPSQDDVNRAIVECLEGSEQEDELVAQQMQQALENGQLDRVSEMLGSLGMEIFDDDSEDDEGDGDWNLFGADSV